MNKTTRLREAGKCVLAFLFSLAFIWMFVSCSDDSNSNPDPEPSSLFRFSRTVQVTPDNNYSGVIVGFCRINYVPATDRFVVTFEAKLAQPSGSCSESGYAYKEYTTDLQETGKNGVFYCVHEDSGSCMIDNNYYIAFADMTNYGFHVLKLDAVNWTILAEKAILLEPKEQYTCGDPMVTLANGRLDISSQYNASGSWPAVENGAATYHQFYNLDFELLDSKILSDTPHICGMSMIYVNGVYHLVTANAYSGDLVVMRYDENWNYLGVKTLIAQANWSTGMIFYNNRFYVAYLDTRLRTSPGYFPVYMNVHLAAFDSEWNLLEDIAVTDYKISDNMQTGRPWLILHGSNLYVSYDVDTFDPVTHEEQHKSQAVISVYELTQN